MSRSAESAGFQKPQALPFLLNRHAYYIKCYGALIPFQFFFFTIVGLRVVMQIESAKASIHAQMPNK